MRKFLVPWALCFCSFAMHGQKTRYGQELPFAKPGVNYPIKVHVSGVHYRSEYFGPEDIEQVLYADTVINGKKVELRTDDGIPFQYLKVPLGDLRARLLKDPQKMGDAMLFQVYEVVLPDRHIWRGTVTGVSE